MTSPTQTIRLAMLGFGNAGQAFARLLLAKREEILARYGFDVQVVAITTRSRGNLLDPSGIDLAKALDDLARDGCFDQCSQDWSGITSMEVAENVDYDVLLELTPLEIFSGQPAIDHLKAALTRGRHAITANKGPLAWAYRELKELATAHSVEFFYETTVMDGTPVFNLVVETLRLCKVTKVEGILNTTTNFVLEELASGKAYDQVIAEGKRRGFIEADPAMDLEGWDAAAKLTALLNVLMDAGITPRDIQVQGIQGITESDIQAAIRRGNRIKLVCRGWRDDAGQLHGQVGPEEVPADHLYATIDGTSSVVSITTDLMGKLSVVEHAPEIEQTAYGILSDLLRLLSRQKEEGFYV